GSFDDLYMRNPTDYELQQSENMVDGGASLLFDQSGNSKGDYENIMVGSAEFTEGFIRKCFQQFMLRQPTSSEMGLANQQISVALDWKTFLKQLVSTDEYAGF
ncbi:MAG TPA: hypothetical protein DCQ93_05140, partial [Bacteroidetes bacterium]|nr:hypothetical protein [Bacteroidota bacterium]